MSNNYQPQQYWEKRLSTNSNLRGVGCLRFGKLYNTLLYKAKSRVLNKVISREDLEIKGKTICDVGSGTGFFVSFYLAKGAKKIVGVDITEESIRGLKTKYPKEVFVREDISSTELLAKIADKFEVINVFDILYHIKDDNSFEKAINNLSKLLENGGKLILTDYLGKKDLEPAPHVKFRSLAHYEDIFEKTGLQTISIYPLYWLLNRPVCTIFSEKINRSVDNLASPFYYELDRLLVSPKRNNLNLLVAQKKI